jgi:hypothetical protein
VNARSGVVQSLWGILFLVVGLSLLAEVGTSWHKHTALEEPANPGKTPNPSTASPFFKDFEGMTERERDRLIREELAELHEQGRRDVLRMRIRLYAIAPAGLLMIAIGTWLLTVSPRR